MDQSGKLVLYRDRFYGRQDVYGRYWSTVADDGGKRAGYAPKCDNFWKPVCHLKNKTGQGCDNCEHKKYAVVSDESIVKHLTGEEAHIQYVLQTDGTVKFAAVDFDVKPGKEDKGYDWPDVRKYVDQLEAWGIPYAAARSTTNGFHIYAFFEDFYPANRIRSIILEAFDRIGFMEYLRMNIKSIPEIFPKQSYVSSSGLGNGIKTPMIIPNFPKERNGFVTRENEWVGKGLEPNEMIAAQWAYLAAVPKVTTAHLDALIEREKIEVFEDSPLSDGKGASKYMSHYNGGANTKWQPPLSGSIEKVLEGCAAFRKIKDKCAKKQEVGHDEGFALYHLAMRTSDGLKWFIDNVPGWGKSDSEMKQLEHSIKKNYSPWTCRTMQDKGICVKNTQCFKKKPPVETVEGQTVVRNDLPVDKWPEPSPVRYAFSAGDDFMKKLMEEALALKDEKDKEKKFAELQKIAIRAQVFDEEQQKEMKLYLREQKVAKIGEVAKLFNHAADVSTEELKGTAEKIIGMTKEDENLYRKKEPYGYAIVKIIRTKTKELSICDADISIEKSRTYSEDDRETEQYFLGTAKTFGVEKKFEISLANWGDDKEFYIFFLKLLGKGFRALKANVPFIRQAVMAFSDKEGIEDEAWFLTQGWYREHRAYIMPSVVVDKDGVRPNSEQKVDLTRKSHAKYLDFCTLEESEFRELLLHIKGDYLNAWPRQWSMVSLAHALLPVFLGPMGSAFSQKPTLFLEGLTGAGKTALTKVVQCFWGNFEKILTLQSSAKGAIDVGYDFKDALLVVDDYKGLNNEQKNAVKLAIQYSYGDDSSVKMNRNQTQNKAKSIRSVFMMTGEEFLEGEASMVARCILIETGKQDTTKTKEHYLKCMSMKSKYSGVTARYINWFLNQDKGLVQDLFTRILDGFHSKTCEYQNASRISYNLAVNHLSWRLFTDFMLHHDAISHKEAKELVDEHLLHANDLLWKMIKRCEDEQSGWVFVQVLRQLLDSGEVAIKGLKGFDHPNKKVIGFAGKNKNHLNVYPDLTWQTAKNLRDVTLTGNTRSIGRQLKDLGVLIDTDGDRTQKQVRGPDGSRQRVWVFDRVKMGYTEDHSGSTAPLDFEPSEEGEQRLDGII